MSERGMRTLLLRGHRKNCHAVKATKEKGWQKWESPWGCLAFGNYGEPRLWRSRTGRAHRYGRTSWLQYVCNDPDCRGRLLVNELDVADAAQRVLDRATR